MNTVRTFASLALAAALAGSSFAFAADSTTRHGRDSVYATTSPAAASRVASQADYDGLQPFGRAGGIPLAKKLATTPKREVQAGRGSLPQRFGRA